MGASLPVLPCRDLPAWPSPRPEYPLPQGQPRGGVHPGLPRQDGGVSQVLALTVQQTASTPASGWGMGAAAGDFRWALEHTPPPAPGQSAREASSANGSATRGLGLCLWCQRLSPCPGRNAGPKPARPQCWAPHLAAAQPPALPDSARSCTTHSTRHSPRGRCWGAGSPSVPASEGWPLNFLIQEGRWLTSRGADTGPWPWEPPPAWGRQPCCLGREQPEPEARVGADTGQLQGQPQCWLLTGSGQF